jgi:hypothetical protein
VIAAGDLQAGPYLNVLGRLDRYQAAAKKNAYDDAARERLLAKMNRIIARLEAARLGFRCVGIGNCCAALGNRRAGPEMARTQERRMRASFQQHVDVDLE